MIKEGSYSIGGIKIRLLKVERNHHFLECKNCSTYMNPPRYYECPFIDNSRTQLNINPRTAKSLIACYAVFQIVNTTEETMDAFEYYLYDTKARVYASNWAHPCETIMKNRVYSYSSIKAQSINNVFVFFPELPIDLDISRIAVDIGNCYLYFNIKPVDKQTTMMLQQDQETRESLRFPNEEEALISMNQYIPIIEVELAQLMDESTHQREKRKLLDNIEAYLSNVQNDMTEIRPSKRKPFEMRINNISNSLEKIRKITEERWEYNLKYQRQAERLYYMTPREFELWCGRLFTALGYEAEVTQYIGDGGIDIILTKDGETYGVQCKKYEEIVHYEEVVKLLYDCKKMNLKRSIFITTGFYNDAAIAFCKKHSITYIDRFDIGEIIQHLYESGVMHNNDIIT